jgi:hypothetical protein
MLCENPDCKCVLSKGEQDASPRRFVRGPEGRRQTYAKTLCDTCAMREVESGAQEVRE